MNPSTLESHQLLRSVTRVLGARYGYIIHRGATGRIHLSVRSFIIAGRRDARRHLSKNHRDLSVISARPDLLCDSSFTTHFIPITLTDKSEKVSTIANVTVQQLTKKNIIWLAKSLANTVDIIAYRGVAKLA